jgi:hypothetical protein
LQKPLAKTNAEFLHTLTRRMPAATSIVGSSENRDL